MAAGRSEIDPENICPKCQSESTQRDECAAEEVTVCKECGHILEAGGIDMRKDYQTATLQMPAQNRSRSKSYMCRVEMVPQMPRSRQDKKKRILSHLDRIADKMRLQGHQKQLCVEKVDEILRIKDISEWKPDEAVAAGVVYVFATDQSPLALKRIKSIGSFKEKFLRKMINKKLKELPSAQSTEPPLQKDARSVMGEYIDMLKIPMDLEERKKCISMCSDLWGVMQSTDMKQAVQGCNPSIISSVILVTLEHIRKTKDQELIEHVARQLDTQLCTFSSHLGRVKGSIFKVSKRIPSLDDLIQAGSLTVHSIVRYIPTILLNKEYISVDHTINKDKDPERKARKRKRTEDPSKVAGEPCIPLELNWPEDDSESLAQLNVDQYLATDNEIEAKKRVFEMQEQRTKL